MMSMRRPTMYHSNQFNVKMKSLKYIILLVALLAAVSCQEWITPSSRYGSIVINLDTGDGLSLKTKDEAAEKAKGCQFSNVLVILTDYENKVVDKKYETISGDPVNSKTIQFENLLPGHYIAYAYANIDQTIWQDDPISSEEKNVSIGADFSPYLDRQLKLLAATAAPENPTSTSLLLLTGTKNIEVAASGSATEILELKRPVVRFKVTINNTTNYPVTVNDLSFSHFNTDRAFLLEHSSDGDDAPDVPSNPVYRELPAYTHDSQTVAAGSEGIVYSTYLYENVSTNEYKIFATLTLHRSSAPEEDLVLSLGERPLGVISYNMLMAMDEGESVDVLLVNPRNTIRSGRLYYGIGPDGLAWESCGYTSFNGFLARARAIYLEKSSFFYDGFAYTGTANNKSGLAGWSGDNNVDPLTGDPQTHNIYFNYTNARSTYFHTLTKSNNLFSLAGLAVNPATESSIEGMKIIRGTKSNNFPQDLQADYLVEFRNASNQALKSDCVWVDTTDPDVAKQCKLSWEANNQNKQDHQFILFGKLETTGSLLKRILKGNNKEVPMTYMSRNEDINVVINVFFADQAGELDFRVDNSHWTDDASTTPSHYFN